MDLVNIQHPRQSFLGLKVVLVSRTSSFETSLLSGLVGDPVLGLLSLVVLGEKRTFFLAVGTFDVVETFRYNTHLLIKFTFLFLELLDLETHDVIGTEVLHFLKAIISVSM